MAGRGDPAVTPGFRRFLLNYVGFVARVLGSQVPAFNVMFVRTLLTLFFVLLYDISRSMD